MVRLGQRAMHREPSPHALLWGLLAGLFCVVGGEVYLQLAQHQGLLLSSVATSPAAYCLFRASRAQAEFWAYRTRERMGLAGYEDHNRGPAEYALVHKAPFSEELYGSFISAVVALASAAMLYVPMLVWGLSGNTREAFKKQGGGLVAAIVFLSVAIPAARWLVLFIRRRTLKTD